MRYSKDELQLLQVERQASETAQECMKRVQQEYQELRVEKEQLLGSIEDLELQKNTWEANEKQAQEQVRNLQEQISSLTTTLEAEKEQ